MQRRTWEGKATSGWKLRVGSARIKLVRVAGNAVRGLLDLGADVEEQGLPYKVRPDACLQPPDSPIF
jgi:hypothetical protein